MADIGKKLDRVKSELAESKVNIDVYVGLIKNGWLNKSSITTWSSKVSHTSKFLITAEPNASIYFCEIVTVIVCPVGPSEIAQSSASSCRI
jgi:hypothetical protein